MPDSAFDNPYDIADAYLKYADEAAENDHPAAVRNLLRAQVEATKANAARQREQHEELLTKLDHIGALIGSLTCGNPTTDHQQNTN